MTPDRYRGWSAARWVIVTVTVLVLTSGLQLRGIEQATGGSQSEQVTFTKHIAPILQRSCETCHRPSGVAPMSLVTYEEVRPWAKAIKYRTGLGSSKQLVMPPWFIDKTVGIQRYKEDMSLRSDEIATIARWADSGAPRGNPADMPLPLEFEDSKWQIGQPDLIVSSPSVEMPPVAADKWGPVGVVDAGLKEDRYVAAIEIKEVTDSIEAPQPGRPAGGALIVHHMLWGVTGGDRPLLEEAGGWRWPSHEAGRNPYVLDPEAGRLITAGSKLSFFGVHMHANGRRTKSHLEVGFKFHARGYKPTKELLDIRAVAPPMLDIRPNEADQKAEGFRVLEQNVKVMMFEPHLHAPGARQCLEALWENTVETLTCAGYNHNWVRIYSYADDAQPLLPKGTILRVTSYFDTTPANKNVVDSRNWSGLGHRSIDNMAIGIVIGLPLTDQEFAQEMAKRREHNRQTKGDAIIGCPKCGVVQQAVSSANDRRTNGTASSGVR